VTQEDRASGDIVCTECGLCERLLLQDDVDYMDVDWSRISLTTKSQHVPERYMLDLIRKFKVDEKLVPELTLRYRAFKLQHCSCCRVLKATFACSVHTAQTPPATRQTRRSG